MEEIEIRLPDDQILVLCLAAHEQNITLNQLVNDILREAINREKVALADAAIVKQIDHASQRD